MDFEDVISKYLQTLIRKNIVNIDNNKFLKKPYLENYMIKLSYVLDKELMINKILHMISNDKITKEELFLIIKNNIELSNEDKKNVEKYFMESSDKVGVELIMYQVKYFRTYQIITELLFEDNDNELYYFIFLYVKNKKSEINFYSKRNFKFNVFNYYLNDLFSSYENIVQNYFIKNKLISDISKKDILNLFLKNLFSHWHVIYKKDILEDNINDKIKDYIIENTNILSKILCMKNV